MINLGDEIILKVEKITSNGLGLSRFGEEKFVVFIEGALLEETLKVKITKLNKKQAFSKIIEIIEPSPYRISPICPLYNACGSCNLGICDYDYSAEIKANILKDTFLSLICEDKFKDFIKSPIVNCYRKKIQFPARQTKNSKRMLLGYFKNNSNDLVNIKFCPLQDEIIGEICAYLRQNFPFDCYKPQKHKGFLRNVVFRITQNQKEILLTFVINSNLQNYKKYYDKKFNLFIEDLVKKFNQIKSVFVNFNTDKTNKILSLNDLKIYGCDSIIEFLEDKKFKISSQSFFQINPACASKLFNVIKKEIKEGSTLLDAYCGVGAIGIFLSDKIKKITFVEENKNAFLNLGENLKLNNIKNCEIFEGDAKKHLKDFCIQKRKFDYSIIDPPRKGCDIEGLLALSKISENIFYVSCNIETLKRDMIILKNEGFEAQFIQGADFFPYTYHIEALVLFKKVK